MSTATFSGQFNLSNIIRSYSAPGMVHLHAKQAANRHLRLRVNVNLLIQISITSSPWAISAYTTEAKYKQSDVKKTTTKNFLFSLAVCVCVWAQLVCTFPPNKLQWVAKPQRNWSAQSWKTADPTKLGRKMRLQLKSRKPWIGWTCSAEF